MVRAVQQFPGNGTCTSFGVTGDLIVHHFRKALSEDRLDRALAVKLL
jgi:hypothetical protein